MIIFRDQLPIKRRNKKAREGRILIGLLGIWVLTLGALGWVIYKSIQTEREIAGLKEVVEELRHGGGGSSIPVIASRGIKGVGVAKKITDDKGNVFDTFVVDLNKARVKIYYQDEEGKRLGSFKRLKDYLENNEEELLFAMNGGMYEEDGTPVGLLVVNGKELAPLNLKGGDPNANFYLKPNGVFALTDKEALIMESSKFDKWPGRKQVVFATQSGPMLIIDGKLHPKINPSSTNVNVRNGVGIISPNQIVFAISEGKVNFNDFAALFQRQFSCKNALFLDGAVSRTYLPALERYDLDGDFGGLIAVSK